MDQVKHSGDSRLDTNISQELTVQINGSQVSSIADQPTIAGNPEQSQSLSEILPKIPGYTIEGILGRGGMGVVYQALQRPLNRPVALKMILSGEHAAPEDRLRFLAEAESIARIQHPSIVQLYEFGSHEGHPYFALELVTGGTLEKKLSGTPLPPREAAILVEKLARAMQAAHDLGIVHRDLKPANILLTGGGEPKITDFGLAKTGGSNLTATGAILGTPSYMAPEQADGKKDVGAPADVYALGAILYECLTGRPPFKAATHLDTIIQVVNSEPVSVRNLQITTPRDLETICHKCLVKEPGKRYATMGALAEDLQRYLHNEPIEARPVGRVEKAWRWCKRNPVVSGLTAAIAASLIVLTVSASILAIWAVTEKERADGNAKDLSEKVVELTESQKKALASESEAVANAYVANMNLASAEWKDVYDYRRLNSRLNLLEEKYGKRFKDSLEMKLLTRLMHTELWAAPPEAELSNYVGNAAFRLDDNLIVQVISNDTGKHAATCNIFNARSGKLLRNFQIGSLWDGIQVRNSYFQISTDALIVAIPERSNNEDPSQYCIGIYDTRNGNLINKIKPYNESLRSLIALALNADGSKLAISQVTKELSGVISIYETRTGQLTHSVKMDIATGDSFGKRFLLFCPTNDNKVLFISASYDVTQWDSGSNHIHQYNLNSSDSDKCDSIAYSPDGQWLAAAQSRKSDNTNVYNIRIIDSNTGSNWHTLKMTDGWDRSLAFSPDNRYLVRGFDKGCLAVYDLVTGHIAQELRGQTGWTTGLTYSHDGKYLYASSSYFEARTWDLRRLSTERIDHFRSPNRAIGNLRYVNNDTYLTKYNGNTYLGDPRGGLQLYSSNRRSITGPVIDSHANYAITFHKDRIKEDEDKKGEQQGPLCLLENTTKKIIRFLGNPGEHYRCIEISPSGDKACAIAFRQHDSKIQAAAIVMWNLVNGSEILRIDLRYIDITLGSRLFITKDETCLICCVNNAINVYSILDGKLHVSTGPLTQFNPIHTCAFSKDDRLMAVACHRDLFLVSWSSPPSIHHLGLLPAHIEGLVFSYNDKRLFSCSSNNPGFLKIWDVQSMLELTDLGVRCNEIDLSPDGRFLSFLRESSSDDNSIRRLWKGKEIVTWDLISPESCNEPRYVAEGLVHYYLSKPFLKSKARQALDEDKSLSSNVRSEALKILEKSKENASGFEQAAFSFARYPKLSSECYSQALKWATIAADLGYDSAQSTLALSQYRCGQFRQALMTLSNVILLQELGSRLSQSSIVVPQPFQRACCDPVDLAVIAMSYHHLGNTQDSDKYVELAAEAAFQVEWVFDDERFSIAEESFRICGLKPNGRNIHFCNLPSSTMERTLDKLKSRNYMPHFVHGTWSTGSETYDISFRYFDIANWQMRNELDDLAYSKLHAEMTKDGYRLVSHSRFKRYNRFANAAIWHKQKK